MAPFLRLKYERLKRNLSQAELARRTGIPQPHICNFERGRLNPTEQELFKLANAMLISPPRVLMQECRIADPAPEPDDPEPDYPKSKPQGSPADIVLRRQAELKEAEGRLQQLTNLDPKPEPHDANPKVAV